VGSCVTIYKASTPKTKKIYIYISNGKIVNLHTKTGVVGMILNSLILHTLGLCRNNIIIFQPINNCFMFFMMSSDFVRAIEVLSVYCVGR